jgi:hypothetical protein
MSSLKGDAAELFVELLTYMHKAATDPAGIAEVIKTPPASIKGDAAKEWKCVAPALAKWAVLLPVWLEIVRDSGG